MAGTLHSSVSSLAGYTFTASGECYELNSTGTIAGPFGPNVPAITDAGFKARQSLTNKLLQSQAADSASWDKFNATVTANAVAAPDGTATADKLVEPAATAIPQIRQIITAPASATTYTFSRFLKAGERSWAVVLLFDGSNGNRFWINLSTGTVGSTTVVGGGLINASCRVTACGDGWYRATLIATTHGGTALHAFTEISTGDGVGSYAGNGASGIYIWQADLYEGANLPDSGPLIVTTTAAATRGAALLSHNIFADGSALADRDMLIWANGTPSELAAYARFLQLSDGTIGNAISLALHNGAPFFEVTSGSVVIVSQTSGSIAAGEQITLLARRLSGAWRGGFYKGGILTWLAAAATAAMPGGVTKATAGNRPDSASYALRGTLDSTFIKPGTFDTDQKVIDAITGAP